MAPLSMLLVLACSPDQYQQSGEYDDVYFTRNDRAKQPEVVTDQAALAQQLSQTNSQATIPAELQERYSNNTGPVTYYEDQGVRVQSARDLNYDDFLYDYENENLAYYELPLDWDTDWSRNSFNDLMAQDVQFRMAWYDQYYQGDDWRMRQYLSGRSGTSSRNWNMNGPRVGVGMGFNSFGPGFYPAGMMAVDLNPWGFYDPFWRPIPTFRFSVGLGFGFGNPYYCPPYAPIYTGYPGGIIVVNDNNININNRSIVRGGRIGGTSVSSVQTDSQNGAQIRTRSQRIAQRGGNASGGSSMTQIQRNSSGRVVAAGRTARGSSGRSVGTRASRADLTVDNVRRVNPDANRFNSSRTRTSRNRVNASQVSSGRSASGSSRAGRNSGFSRADITRANASRSRGNSNYNRLSFDRNSSSSISRSVSSRSSYNRGSNSSSRGFSFGNSRNSSGFSRSSGSSFSRGSSSRSSGSFSRGSSSRSSSGSSRSSSSSSRSSSSSSSGSSRSGRN